MRSELNDLGKLVEEAAGFIVSHTSYRPRIGIILGSGLGGLADVVCPASVIPYSAIPHFPRPTVEGHIGELIIGELEGWQLAVMCGRPHLYEGFTPDQLGFPVRVLHKIGCEILIVTNASGGLNPGFRAGDLVLITDHINLPGLVGLNPLVGHRERVIGQRFISMGNAYDPQLAQLAYAAAKESGIDLKEGVYVMVGGPSYETAAELNFLRAIGADVVGMSTAPEVVVARCCGMRVLGISCVTNSATGAEEVELTHLDVLVQGQAAVPRLTSLVRSFLRLLHR